MLVVENLRTYFNADSGAVKAVDDVCLELRKEEIVGLVGESGCGKSTVALSIIRLVPDPPGKIMSGRVMLKGENLLEMSEAEFRNRIRGKEISMIFQDPMTYLNPTMRVRDQIAETILLHQGGSKEDARRKVIDLLRRVEVSSPERTAKAYPHELSGGLRQRVLIAMAISCNPALLIADEPTTALDVTVQAKVLEVMKNLVKDLKTSLLFITHDLGIVADICDRVYVMYAGRIVEYGNTIEIFEDSRHPYTQGLLKSTLSIDEFKEKLVTLDGNVPDLTSLPVGCRFHPRCSCAMAICKADECDFVEVGEDHMVSCWLCRKGDFPSQL